MDNRTETREDARLRVLDFRTDIFSGVNSLDYLCGLNDHLEQFMSRLREEIYFKEQERNRGFKET